jgi:hypothetical protein
MKTWLSYIRPRYLAVAAVAVLCISVITYIMVAHGGDQPATARTDPKPSAAGTPTQAQSQAVAKDESSAIVRERSRLNARVKAFCEFYFSRPAAEDKQKAAEVAQEIRTKVTPYVTANFLRDAPFGFGSSDADQAMIREQASMEAVAVSDFDSEEFNPDVEDKPLAGTIKVVKAKLDRNHQEVVKFTHVQELIVVKHDGAWYIDEAPAT